MSKTLKQIATLSLLTSVFHSGIAGEMGAVKQATSSANSITAGGFYLRPGGSSDYGVLVSPFNPAVATPILSPSWQPEGINPDFKAGFFLNLSHIFANEKNDLSLYWAHLRAKDESGFPINRNPPPAQQFAGPFWNVGPDAGTTSSASGLIKNNFDTVTLEMGQNLDLGALLKTRVFAGVSGLWLQQKTDALFTGTDPILGFYTFGVGTSSKYNAGGLRLGINGETQNFQNVSLVGALAGAVYIGSQQPLTTTIGTGSILARAGIPVNHQTISHKSYIQAVPAVDAKLGLKFSKQFNDTTVALEAGYQAAVYVNAIQNYVPSTYVPGSLGIVAGSVFLQSLVKTTESFSLDGPYVSASVKM